MWYKIEIRKCGYISDKNKKMDRMKMSELILYCKNVGIKGWSNKNKKELICYMEKKGVCMNKNECVESKVITREYLNKEKVCLINGDCLEEMSKIENKSIDLILCDLPYGMTKNKWDVVISFEKLWLHYNRIIKENGAIILFGSQPFTTMMISSNMKYFRYTLVWEKNKFSDFLNAKRKPMKTNEDICVFYKKQPTYNIQYWYSTPYKRWNTQKAVNKQSNYGNHKKNVSKSDGKRLPTTVLKFNRVERPAHPTQKPVDLLEWLIKSYTNEGENVLDNCMGVGSTGIAAKKNNRNFIGIELNETYFNKAVEFIEKQESKT
jgi:site-specific DNA-methyltransferase (adenine-specific)|tara:strand:- start:1772 stop:2731 length:960 start_codon:yes stop_codon:yes gene_type:complete